MTTAFMVATTVMAVVCAIAAFLRSEALEVFSAGAAVFVFTVISRLWSSLTDLPVSAVPWPVQDLICGVMAAAMFAKHREWWKLCLALAFGAQSAFHVIYFGTVFSQGGATWAQNVEYVRPINILFAFELAVLTLAGGWHIASHVSHSLRVSGGNRPFDLSGVAGGR